LLHQHQLLQKRLWLQLHLLHRKLLRPLLHQHQLLQLKRLWPQLYLLLHRTLLPHRRHHLLHLPLPPILLQVMQRQVEQIYLLVLEMVSSSRKQRIGLLLSLRPHRILRWIQQKFLPEELLWKTMMEMEMETMMTIFGETAIR
jgi:hypothetical protein